MRCDVKNLYRSKPDEFGDIAWTEEYPTFIKDLIESSRTQRYALLVRHIKSSASHNKLELHSIVTQSPLLKNSLGTILDGYPGVTTNLDWVEFHKPFEPFVHG